MVWQPKICINIKYKENIKKLYIYSLMYSDEIDLFQAYATHKTPTSLSIKLVMHKKIANINKILEEALYCPNEVKLALKKELNELKDIISKP